MLQYRCRTACTSALSVFALTDDILAVTECFVDILCKIRRFGEEAIVGISLFRQIVEVEVIDFAIEHIITGTAVIDTGIVLVDMLQLRVTKADNSGILRKFTVGNNGLDGFS